MMSKLGTLAGTHPAILLATNWWAPRRVLPRAQDQLDAFMNALANNVVCVGSAGCHGD